MKRIRGIDVSKWQGTINWKSVAMDSARFVMICLGYGSAQDEPAIDPRFQENINHALANQIPVGIYFHTYAQTPEAARHEAEWTVNQLKPYWGQISYPIALDIEHNGLLSQSQIENSAIVTAYCGALEEFGYYAMYYTSFDFLQNRLDYESLRRFDLWIAQYNAINPSDYAYGIWQYSNEGTMQGIQGYTDLNDSLRDYPAIIKKAGLNGFANVISAASATSIIPVSYVTAPSQSVTDLNSISQPPLVSIETDGDTAILPKPDM